MSGRTPGPWKYLRTSGFDYGSTEYWIPSICSHIKTQDNARLIAAAPDLLEACQTFSEWLRREEAGFDHKTHDRKTPEGEAAWREWYYENIAICGFAQELVRDAIAKATGEQA